MKIVIVGPEQAKRWLSEDVNENNRNISKHTVTGYASEMKAGRWLLGSPVMFSPKGKLIDGQHRLSAVIEYGKGVRFAVLENVDDAVRAVIDQGRARSVPDMLRMLYGVNRATMITGVIRILDDFVYGQKFKLSVGHALEMIERFDEAFKWAADVVPGKTTYSASAILAALVYAHRTAPTTVDSFARRLFTGNDLTLTNPILIVRNQLQRMGSLAYRDQKREAFMVVLHGIYKSLNNQSVTSKSLRVREDMLNYFGAAFTREKKRAAG
jgi:hypothetical protein